MMRTPLACLLAAALLAPVRSGAQEPAFATPAPEDELEEPDFDEEDDPAIVDEDEAEPAEAGPVEEPTDEAEPPPAALSPSKGSPAPDEAEPAPADGIHVELGLGMSFSLDGYYRARYLHVGDFNQLRPMGWKHRKLDYFVQRLRLEPALAYKDLVKLEMWIHALDNVVWGDNAGLSSVGLFAGNPSSTNQEGDDVPSIALPAVWVEINVVLGVLRAGRMPSDWGLGLLTDGGGGFDDDFGWNDVMSISDRVMFATMPVAIAQTIAKSDADPFPLYLVVAYDKLVTDDTAIGGARIPYLSNWLGTYEDDVDSFTAALAYGGEDLNWLGASDSLGAGFYYVQRWQNATNSRIHIYDWYLKLHLGPAFAEYEHYLLKGHSQAIPLLPSATDDPDDWLRERAEADISAWIARVGIDVWKMRFKLEAGYASGDATATDEKFEVRPANPNVRIGLVLFPLVLAERTRGGWADQEGMWSGGGLYNAWFFMQTVRYEPLDGLEIILAFLQAWRDEADGAVISSFADGKFLGFETDLAVKYHFHEGHAHIGVEGGVLHAGDALKGPGFNTPDNTWTVQVWTAFTP
ncbi:MAG: alginate export family protein [Deltaproteobacteria bacterium]|nr:alginate export family protein [Deltaproteobacteria bacterium]